MEGRIRKYGGQASSPLPALMQQQKQGRKIPVVYYLCRNRQLEHPHFIEVPLSSPDGLFLRDVICRLNVLRGKGMAAMYSWSCKRSYKNGFVWHDLSEDDLILPTNGTEFVLKGSELLDQLPSDKAIHGGAMGKPQNLKLSQSENPTPTSSRTNESSSSSSPTAFKDSKTPSPPSPSPPPPSPPRLASPTNTSTMYKPSNAADASTQTEDGGRRTQVGRKNTRTRGVSTDENSIDFEYESNQLNRADRSNNGSELCRDEVSPQPTSSSASSSGRKMETLESLIRADCSKVNSFRILEEEEILIPTGPRLKATNVFMQLVTCGSISVKDHHSFGLVPTYKPKFSHVKFPSSVLANSVFIGELDYLSENPSFVGLRVEDKEYFSGSLLETKRLKEDVREGLATLKRSSSFNADRTAKSPYSKKENEGFVDSKCLPRPVKLKPNKPSRNELMRSAISDCPRNSSVGQKCSQSSIDVNKRITEIPSVKEDDEKTIKIEAYFRS